MVKADIRFYRYKMEIHSRSGDRHVIPMSKRAVYAYQFKSNDGMLMRSYGGLLFLQCLPA